MIKVQVTIINNLYKSVIVKGHANAGEFGKDLVCAGVSSILIGTINALGEIKGSCDFKQDEGYAEIKFENDCESQTIAKTLIFQLKTIEESNKKNIKINYSKTEV